MRLAKAGDRAIRERELDHSAVTSSELRQVPGFVLKASTGQDLEFRVLPLGTLDLTACGGQLLLGQVLALEKARQIGRAHDQPALKKLHLALLLQGSL